MICKYFFCWYSNFFLKLLIGPDVFGHVKTWHTLGFTEKILMLVSYIVYQMQTCFKEVVVF